MPAGLPLMKSILTPPAKSVLLPFGLLAGVSATNVAIQKKKKKKKKSWIRNYSINNFQWGHEKYNENS